MSEGDKTAYRQLGNIHLQRTAGPYMRVKTGKAHSEHMLSAVHPMADSTRTSFHVRNVPIPEVAAV